MKKYNMKNFLVYLFFGSLISINQNNAKEIDSTLSSKKMSQSKKDPSLSDTIALWSNQLQKAIIKDVDLKTLAIKTSYNGQWFSKTDIKISENPRENALFFIIQKIIKEDEKGDNFFKKLKVTEKIKKLEEFASEIHGSRSTFIRKFFNNKDDIKLANKYGYDKKPILNNTPTPDLTLVFKYASEAAKIMQKRNFSEKIKAVLSKKDKNLMDTFINSVYNLVKEELTFYLKNLERDYNVKIDKLDKENLQKIGYTSL